MKKLVVLTGAGMSAESGIQTFRGTNGMWENHSIQDVATLTGWKKNPELVLRFYSERRKKVVEAQPNQGHLDLVELEKFFDVQIITQNVDDLHERAGSAKVLHLHGEIRKSRSSIDPNLIYNIEGAALKLGDLCEKGSQLRPHIVWFGEAVPEINNAKIMVLNADIFAVIGTSLLVYPAAGLLDVVPSSAQKFLIDPNEVNTPVKMEVIQEPASVGVKMLMEKLLTKK